MTASDRYDRVAAIFDEACDLPPDERGAFVREACGDDTNLRRDVESLLEHDARDDAAIQAAEAGEGVRALAADLEDESPDRMPEEIGQYRILRELGRGGMGTVYEAEQKHPKRRVALKVIRAGLTSSEMLKRFRREAEVLGHLQHPGVAHIYEAGVASSELGRQPFLAMEFIDGLPIERYIAENQLDSRQILALMARTCDAVQHAHQKGIIHRDLKPANILVVASKNESGSSLGGDATGTSTTIDAPGYPKVLDFGIARVTDADIQVTTLQTDVGQLIGTLAYMSPEQVLGDPAGIDTRCDVYALSVILYKLLTGRLPLEVDGKSIPEAARMIREEDPDRMSSIDASLRGDVDTIIQKAMEKDRDRRYASAAEVAADIRRFLRDQPIEARPASAMYQFSKFARRNRGLVGGMAATLVVLVFGLVGTTTFLLQAREERDNAIVARNEEVLARQEADAARDEATVARDEAQLTQKRLEAVVAFQIEQLSSISPSSVGRGMIGDIKREFRRGLNRTDLSEKEREAALVSMEEVLERVNATNLARNVVKGVYVSRAKNKLDRGFTDDPIVEADLRNSLSSLYKALGIYEEALDQRLQALALRREHLGEQHEKTLDTTMRVGIILARIGRIGEAERYHREALELKREVLGERHESTISSKHNLANLLRKRGEVEEAAVHFREVLDYRIEILGEEHVDTASTMNELGVILVDQGKMDEALNWFQRTLTVRERILGADHVKTVRARNNVMAVLFNENRLGEAESIARDVLVSYVRVRGDEHPDTIMGRNNLGMVLLRSGRPKEAEPLFREAFEQSRQHLAPTNEIRMKGTSNLVDALIELNQVEEAEEWARELLAVRRTLVPPTPSYLGRALEQVGITLLMQGRNAEAETLLRECLEVREAIDVDHWQTHWTRSLLGASLAGQGRYQEAETLLVEAHAALVDQQGDIPSWRRERELSATRERLADLYDAWAKPEEAAKWRSA